MRAANDPELTGTPGPGQRYDWDLSASSETVETWPENPVVGSGMRSDVVSRSAATISG